MQIIKSHIVRKQQAFSQHSFFRWLETANDREDVATALSQLAFWVASYQDVLAINGSRIDDARFRVVHTTAGHDRHFFQDLHRLGIATLSAQDLFAKPRAPIRRAAFALMSEVFRANDDVARVTLLLALEAAGHIFFEATADWVERVLTVHDLEYFSRFQVEIERPFAREIDVFLDALDLDVTRRSRCLEVVDRAYEAFELMFDSLLVTASTSAARAA